MLPTCGLALTEYKTCFIGRFNRLCYKKKKKNVYDIKTIDVKIYKLGCETKSQ